MTDGKFVVLIVLIILIVVIAISIDQKLGRLVLVAENDEAGSSRISITGNQNIVGDSNTVLKSTDHV